MVAFKQKNQYVCSIQKKAIYWGCVIKDLQHSKVAGWSLLNSTVRQVDRRLSTCHTVYFMFLCRSATSILKLCFDKKMPG